MMENRGLIDECPGWEWLSKETNNYYGSVSSDSNEKFDRSLPVYLLTSASTLRLLELPHAWQMRRLLRVAALFA